jgi:prepilin-type N-terminal cleavage/methylation domain-containing protein
MNQLIKKAFTLIELLVVIAIIGILSGLIIVTMNGATQKATVAKSQVFSNSLRSSLMANLISEWKFDELTTAVQGSSIQDTWSGGNTGTLSTNSDGLDKIKTGSNCVSGNCLSFDGTDDYVYVSGSDSTSSNLAITGAITLSAWVKFNNTSTSQFIIGRGLAFASNGNYGYALTRLNSTSKIRFETYSTTAGDWLASTSTFNDNNWHYVVGTWDGTINAAGKKIYIDGTLDSQGTSLISVIGQPSYEFRVGKDGAGNYKFNGLIDDVRIYNTAIPTSQIKEQYYAGLNKLLINGSITKEEYALRIK